CPLWSITALQRDPLNVRVTRDSGHRADIPKGPSRAVSRHWCGTRQMADQEDLIRHPVFCRRATFSYYCAHKEAARAISAGVGTKGGDASTFELLAFVIRVGASDARRKRCWTALFTAAVTTQT